MAFDRVTTYVHALRLLLRRPHPNAAARHVGLASVVDDEQFEVLESGVLWDEIDGDEGLPNIERSA
jgi:hypothetical protein